MSKGWIVALIIGGVAIFWVASISEHPLMPDSGSSLVTYSVAGDVRSATVKYSIRGGTATEEIVLPWSTSARLPAGELAAVSARSRDEAGTEIAVSIAAPGLDKWKWESARKPAGYGWVGTSLRLEWYAGDETLPPPGYHLEK